jgi:sarcosine oxidase subunit gamma
VAELAARAAAAGLGLPLTVGGATLAALPEAPMWSVAPFRGREDATAAALGTALPTGRVAAVPGGRLIWAGFRAWLLQGPDPGEELAELAAVAAQGDAWCGLGLSGPAARDVLARLVPLDLDPAAFPVGAAARSLLRHTPLLLVAEAQGFELLVPRSYARTAVRELDAAMRGVEARAALGH